MKKIFFSMLTFLAFSAGSSAQTVSVAGDVEALAGESVSVALHITGADAMTSNRFVITLPTGITLSGVKATEAWAGLFSVNKESGEFSSIVSSDNALTGEADIATVTLTVAEGTALGTYPVTIGGTRVNGTSLDTEAAFNVKVVSAHSVVLDELSTEAPAAAMGVNVVVKRTIYAGEWSTICLPFAMTAEQVKTAFGEDVELGDFTGCTQDEETQKVKVNFAAATAIEANHPYIIKVASAIASFTVEGVDVAPTAEPMVQADKSKKNYNSFIGNYVNGTKVDDYGLYLMGGKFWYSKGNVACKAFRGYFVFDSVDVDYDAARLMFSFDDATGISSVKMAADNVFFDLSGRQVSEPRKGVYIKNGKKVIVK